MKDNRVEKVLDEVKTVDNNITTILIPVLQDTIADGNRHNKRMFVITIILSVLLTAISIISMFLIYRQNTKYQEFLSQFEYQGDYTYTQDIDAGDGSSPIINDGIKVNQ